MRVFGPRTIVEAAFLIAVPIVALAAGLHAWPIIGASTAAYLLVVTLEATLARLRDAAVEPPPTPPVPEPDPEPETAALSEPRSEHVRVLRALPSLTPIQRPGRSNVVPLGAPRQWSLWDLERLAREHAGGDPETDEERTFLLLYLRDFADPDGFLPADFDALVRDSFGGLVTQ